MVMITWTATHWQGNDPEVGVTVSIIRTQAIGVDRLWHLVVQSSNRDINALTNTYWTSEAEAKQAVEKRIEEAAA